MSKPYRPSNGTEGDIFEYNFCDRCKKQTDQYGEPDCRIAFNAFWHEKSHPEYPTEWIVDDDGLSNPRCTAFEAKADG